MRENHSPNIVEIDLEVKKYLSFPCDNCTVDPFKVVAQHGLTHFGIFNNTLLVQITHQLLEDHHIFFHRSAIFLKEKSW